jgi:hypothetical protein
MPQMSVFPSRPLALKISGSLKPKDKYCEISAVSSFITSDASAVFRNSETGALVIVE